MKKSQQGFSAIEAFLIFVIVGMIGFIGWYIWQAKQSTNNTQPVANTGSKESFTGKISQINNECSSDGACSITVDGKSVITGGGLAATEAENTYGNLGSGANSRFTIGQTVKVKALKTTGGYTLQACPDCYVK